MNLIKQRFDGEFQPWQIELPIDDLNMRRSGSLVQKGWTINYTFGREGDREYMDFFACHRMTNDTLSRIFNDGEVVQRGYCMVLFRADDPEAEREYYEHNRKFYALVKALDWMNKAGRV